MSVHDDAASTALLPVGAPPPATRPPLGAAVLDAEFSDAEPRRLRDYVRVLYKYRWLAGACFVATVGAAALATLMTPREYSAATRLQLSRQAPIRLRLEDNVLNLDENERNVNGTSSFLATQVAVLKSRDLAERVIRRHRLADNALFLDPVPQRRGLLEVGGELVGALRPRGLDAAQKPRTESGGSDVVDPTLLDRYMSWLGVGDVRGTDLVEVRFTTPNPALSALLAAAHAQAYLEANEEARVATDVTAKEFLADQIGRAQEQVDDAETALRTFASAHPNVAVNEEQKLVGQRLAEITTQVGKAQATRLTMQSRYEFLTHPDADPLAYLLDRPGVQKLHLALLDLRAERTALDGRLGPNHARMQEIGREEAEVRRQLDAEVKVEVAGVQARFDAARGREDALRARLHKLETQAIALRDLGARYERLGHEVDTAKQLHDSLLKQQTETAVNAALAASNVRVVERAEVPSRPSKPNVPLNLVLGVALGGVLALGTTFVCEAFDDSVKSSEEVEGLLQLPTLATIPNFALARRSHAGRLGGPATVADNVRNGRSAPSSARAGTVARTDGVTATGPGAAAAAPRARDLVVLDEPWSPVAEAFRSLRTAVLFSAPGAPPKVIQVTSAGAGEGKTVSSLNLATTLAEAGSRVLLIDVDLRKPSCHRALGVDKGRGLSSYLAGQLELADVTLALEAPRLFFVPAGPTPPNPAELIGSARMRDTLARLRAEYDFVILDSPPVLPVTDAVVLARESDGVVLVVKGHDTPRELVRRARDQLFQANARLLGAVVNNVDYGWSDLFFYNQYYGYYAQPQPEEARAC